MVHAARWQSTPAPSGFSNPFHFNDPNTTFTTVTFSASLPHYYIYLISCHILQFIFLFTCIFFFLSNTFHTSSLFYRFHDYWISLEINVSIIYTLFTKSFLAELHKFLDHLLSNRAGCLRGFMLLSQVKGHSDLIWEKVCRQKLNRLAEA